MIVKARVDTERYETGIKVSDAEMARLRFVPDEFHGDWNYRVKPRCRKN